MKKLNFSKDSWHYKLANIIGYEPKYKDKDSGYIYGKHNADTCTYVKFVFFGGLLSFLALSVIVGVASITIDLFMAIIFSLIYHAWLFTDFATLGLMVYTLLMIFGSTTFIVKMIGVYLEYRKKSKAKDEEWIDNPKKPDGFIKNTYKGWKEKYCMQINFTEE